MSKKSSLVALLVAMAALMSATVSAVEPAKDDKDHEQEHRQLGAHVHGMASLKIALEEQAVAIELESPAANLVGFEHSPENVEEQQRVDQAVAALGDYRNLLTFTGGTCSQAEADVHSPFGEKGGESAHDHDAKAEHEGEVHADFEAGYRLQCPSVAAIESIELTLFDRFPGFEKVKVEWVGPGGQGSKEVTQGDTRLSLK